MKLVIAPAALAELHDVALVGDISSVGFHTASSIRSPQKNFVFLPLHITGGALATGRIRSSSPSSLRPVQKGRRINAIMSDFYLFLDFDGVLHPMLGSSPVEPEQQFSATHRLWYLLRTYPEMRVVFSSSWRFTCTLDVLCGFVTRGGGEDLKDRFIGSTPKVAPIREDSNRGFRQRECEAWLASQGCEEAAWLALDDCKPGFLEICNNFYAVDASSGLSEDDMVALLAKVEALMGKRAG
jgi:hypothetical protein